MTPKSELKRLSAREIVSLSVCPHCAGPVARKSRHGPAPSYCSVVCRTAHNNASLSDGATVIKFAKAWREARGQGEIGSQSFAAMVSVLDLLLEKDRSEGRPSALYAVAPIIVSGTTYLDRRRA